MGLDANSSTNRLSKWLVAIKGRHEKKAWESKNALPDENFVTRRRASHSAIADPQVQRTSVAGQQSLPTRHERTTYLDAVKSGGGFAYGGGGSFDMRPGYFELSAELEPQQRPRSEQARPGVQRQTTYLDAIKTGGGFSYGGGGPFDMHPGHLAPSGELSQRDGRRDVASPQPSALKAKYLEQTASSFRPKQRRASVSGATPPLSATQIPATAPQHMRSARRKSTSSPLPPGHYIHPVTKRLIPPHPNSNFVKSDRHRWPRERYVGHINYAKMYPETVWCGGKDSVAPQTRQHVPAAMPDLSPKKPGLLRKRRDSMSAISPKTVAAAAVEKIIGGGLRGHSRSASDGPVPHPVYPSQPYYPTGQESESYKKQLRRRSAFEPAEPTVPRQVHEPSRGRARSRSMSRVERGNSSAATEDRRLSSFSTSSASAYTGAQPLTRQAAHTGSTISASRQRIHLSSESRGALDYSNPPTGSGLSLPRTHSRRSPSHLIPGTTGGSPTSTSTGSTSQGWGIAYSNGSMLPPYAQNTYRNSSSGSARWRPRSRSLSRDGHSRSRSVGGTSSHLCYTSEACREAERLVRVHDGRW